jgi:hypothetical protein
MEEYRDIRDISRIFDWRSSVNSSYIGLYDRNEEI